MSYSLKHLVERVEYKPELINDLSKRINSMINTGLVGINSVKIGFELTDDIDMYIKYIDSNIQNVCKSDVSDIVVLDSYYSATIEGARTSVDDVLRAFKSKDRTKSEQMVISSINAYNVAKRIGINSYTVNEVWQSLAEGVCENESVRGMPYRTGQVYVASGSSIIHEPCECSQIPYFMDSLFNYDCANILIKSCVLHFYLVYIHPFCDGNGRFARLLTKYILSDYSQSFDYLSVSKEICEELNGYYKSIKESEFIFNDMMDITVFIEYMLSCIVKSVKKGLTNNINLDELDIHILSKINNDGITISKLVNKKYSEYRIRVSLEKLTNLGVVYKKKSGNCFRYYKK